MTRTTLELFLYHDACLSSRRTTHFVSCLGDCTLQRGNVVSASPILGSEGHGEIYAGNGETGVK